MGYVSADLAASLAYEVYGVQDAFELNAFLLRPEFSEDSNSKTSLKASVGSRLVNTKDSFAVCARGAGAFKNDVFLMFRGTTLSHYGADVITDLRVGLNVSATGSLVHSGFNQVFNSLSDALAIFLTSQTGVQTVHCIGHSLGGAVASLTADWIKTKFGTSTKLYTFGAPRVGFGIGGFAQSLTTKLDAENIHRVYHSTDPVPMVPLFPFSHAPTSGRAFYLTYGGLVVNPSAHKMQNYIASIGGNGWEALYRPNPTRHSIESIKAWLQSNTPESSHSSTAWEKLNYALAYVLQLSFAKTQAAIVGGFTIADQLAMILQKGAEVGGEMAKWVYLLIRRMMRIVGMAIVDTAEELTATLIRLVLNRIMQKIAQEVKKAVDFLR
ncbi:MAG: lipase family protein [Cellvibrionaceae bacterium]